jgi:glycosyltransferase involved in cell wall biosynthesis
VTGPVAPRLDGRIAIVTPRYPPAIGGVELHVGEVVKRLAARGEHVEVITTDPSGDLPAVEERDGATIRRFGTLAGDDVFYLAPGLAAWLLRNVDRFAVVHAHSYHTPLAFLAVRAARWRRVPVVVTPHYHGVGHSRLASLLHVPYKPLGLWALRRASAVVVNSDAERVLIAEHLGRGIRPRLIRPGVTIDEFLPTSPRPDRLASEPVRVVAGGRLEPYKQTERVVDAIRHLPAAFSLAVLGDGPARPAIAAATRQPDLAGRVESLGYVDRAELVARYRTADVFVSLSQREAFGLTVLEAAVAGASVIASDIPAHREIAGLLPEGVIRLVPVDAPAADVAVAIQAAAAVAPPRYSAAWDIPTWDRTADACLELYAHLAARATGDERDGGTRPRD